MTSHPLTSGAATLVPRRTTAAQGVASERVLRRRTRAAPARAVVRARAGRSGSDERRSGRGPNQRVAKRRREKTEGLDVRRDARTVEPERAAVSEMVEGRAARRAIWLGRALGLAVEVVADALRAHRRVDESGMAR